MKILSGSTWKSSRNSWPTYSALPLDMLASSRKVIDAPSVTPLTYLSIGSSRLSLPASASCRINVTVNDFVMLRSGQIMSLVTGTFVLRSASPAVPIHVPSPGTHTPTPAPGTSYVAIVWSRASRSLVWSFSGRSPCGAGLVPLVDVPAIAPAGVATTRAIATAPRERVSHRFMRLNSLQAAKFNRHLQPDCQNHKIWACVAACTPSLANWAPPRLERRGAKRGPARLARQRLSRHISPWWGIV